MISVLLTGRVRTGESEGRGLSWRQHRPGAKAARVAIGVCLAVCLLVPAHAEAWSNGDSGGTGYGTHDWVLDQANCIAVKGGYSWLDVPVALAATDDPDTKLHDTYYHIYDIWGDTYGDSPGRVAELYSQVVGELRSGDREAASRSMGLLSHYYSDTGNPLHTDQSPAEESVHSAYELDVQRYTDAEGKNADWVVPDGLEYVSDPRAATCAITRSAHVSYTALVTGYAADRMDPEVLAVSRSALNRAANGIADLIKSAAMDAKIAGAVEAASASTPASGAGGRRGAALIGQPESPTAEPHSAGETVAEAGSREWSSGPEAPPAVSEPTEGPPRHALALLAAALAVAFVAALYGALGL